MRKVLKWLDNYWYHYKWVTIIVAFFVIVGSVMIVQYATRDTYDSLVLYAGPGMPDANEALEIENAFEAILPYDYDENGTKDVSLNPLFLLTDEQIEDVQYTVDEEGKMRYVNTSEMMKTKEQFSTQIFAGESLICLLDPAWYETVKKQDGFVALEYILDSVPEYAVDEYSVYLKDTPFAKYFTALGTLPEDTLLCFRRLPTTTALKNKEKEDARYQFNKELFKAIFEFGL